MVNSLPSIATIKDKLLLGKMRVFFEQAGYFEVPINSALKFTWEKEHSLFEVIWIPKTHSFFIYYNEKHQFNQNKKRMRSIKTIKEFEDFYFNIFSS